MAPSLSDGLTYCILVYQAVWLTMGIQLGILRWKEECVRVTHYRHTWRHTLAVEIMAKAIRKNEHIYGSKIRECEEKLLQYEDDTTGLLADVTSAEEFLKTKLIRQLLWVESQC